MNKILNENIIWRENVHMHISCQREVLSTIYLHLFDLLHENNIQTLLKVDPFTEIPQIQSIKSNQ